MIPDCHAVTDAPEGKPRVCGDDPAERMVVEEASG